MRDLGFTPKPFHKGPVIWSPDRPGPLYLPEHGEAGYLWIPQKGQVIVQHNTGAVGANPFGTSITTGAGASTKGTAVEMITSTTVDSFWMVVICTGIGTTGTASPCAVDILIGAAAEEVLIANLLAGGCQNITASGGSGGRGPKMWMFPIYTPAASRLAAQAASARTATAMSVAVYLYGGTGMPAFRVGSKVTTYGIGTVPNGTAIVPGLSAAEQATPTQITASTSEDHFAVLPSFQVDTDTNQVTNTLAYDVMVGAATEEEIAQSYWFINDSTEMMSGPWPPMPAFTDIPSGSRLAARASNSGGTNDGNYNTVLHCVS